MRKLNQFTRMKLVGVLIFAIPVASLLLFYTFYLLPMYKNNLLNSCKLSVNNAIEALNEKFYSANTLAVQLKNDTALDSVKLSSDDVLLIMDARKQLESYNLVNGMFDEIVMAYKNGNIISSKTVYSLDSLFNAFPQLGSVSEGENGKFFSRLSSPLWIASEIVKNTVNDDKLNSQKYALGLYPVPIIFGDQYAVAIFAVDAQKFLNSVFNLFPYSKTMVLIVDTQSNVVMSNDEAKEMSDSTATINNGDIVTINGEKHFAFCQKLSSAGGLSVKIFVPKAAIMEEVTRLQMLSFTVIVIVTFLCALIILPFIFAYRKSVILLRRAVYGVNDTEDGATDDLLNARQAILSLEKASSRLEEHLSNSQRVVEELERYKFELKQKVENSDITPTISSSWNYILSNYADYNLSVHTLSDMLNMSDVTFSQKFKLKYNMTPSEFIAKIRIDRVKELLITTRQPINTIIEQVGYSDVSSFIRKFKKEVGVTPGQYRNDFKYR